MLFKELKFSVHMQTQILSCLKNSRSGRCSFSEHSQLDYTVTYLLPIPLCMPFFVCFASWSLLCSIDPPTARHLTRGTGYMNADISLSGGVFTNEKIYPPVLEAE